MRGVTALQGFSRRLIDISTHTPHARRDFPPFPSCPDTRISTHTPHARRDVSALTNINTTTIFQLTRLMRGVTISMAEGEIKEVISTHTPHARRDGYMNSNRFRYKHFNSHASCEAWLSPVRCVTVCTIFQLTRLMRGVTGAGWYMPVHVPDFNSHASCEAWQNKIKLERVTYDISTHTPHARRDF